MELPDRVDVVVAGSTIAGLVAARGLAHGGASVLLTGPQGPDDLGLGLLGLAEHPGRVRDSLGADRWRELVGLQRRSAGLIEGEVADQVWAAVIPNELELVDPSVAALDEAGLAAERLERDGLERWGVRADLGFRIPGGASLVSPVAARERWRAAAREGGAVVVPSAVQWVDEDALGLQVVIGGRRVRCEVLVVAHGAGVGRWSTWLADKLSPVREQAQTWPGERVPCVGRAGHGYTWFRPWTDGVAVGGCRWATPHLEVGEIAPVPVPGVQQRIEEFARSRLGRTGAFRGARWAWIEDHSCDELPIVGPLPGAARWVAAVGLGGNEWSLGPAVGQMVVDGLLGGALPTPTMFSTSRFVG